MLNAVLRLVGQFNLSTKLVLNCFTQTKPEIRNKINKLVNLKRPSNSNTNKIKSII